MTGDEFVIPGDNFDIHTGIVQHAEGFMGRLLGGVDECDETVQGKVSFIAYGVDGFFFRDLF